MELTTRGNYPVRKRLSIALCAATLAIKLIENEPIRTLDL